MQLNGYKLKCDFSVAEAIIQLILWILLSVMTFGLALFILPYYFVKAPLNSCTLIDPAGNAVGKVNVEVTFGAILGHALIWLLLTIVTFGLAYLIYWPAVIKRLLNAATIREL
ncbi:MAG: DUF6693 family protein [Sulfitobacter sp.]